MTTIGALGRTKEGHYKNNNPAGMLLLVGGVIAVVVVLALKVKGKRR